MKIVLLQLDTAWENPEANFETVRSFMNEIRDEQSEADMFVCLPEMFATGFSMNVDEMADEPRGKTFEFLSNIARSYEVHLLGTAMERNPDSELGENVAYLLDPDGNELGRYVKIHPFSYSGEDQYYQGGENIVAESMGEFTATPAICYDLRFPELFRESIHRGTDLFVVPANFPEPRLDHWRSLLRARAIENQAYVAGVNRTGSGGGNLYPGHSMVVNPWGNIMKEMDQNEGWLSLKISSDQLREIRNNFPFLNDMKRSIDFSDLT